MKGALTDKILKAFREGRLFRKAAPYVWLCLGLSFAVRLWCRTRKTVPGKIVFNNFHGRGFGDHQKYIALELLRRGFKGEMVWLASDVEAVRRTLPPGIRVVRIGRRLPFAVLGEMATAQFWCSNQSFTSLAAWGLDKRPDQTYINTHHGSLGIKRIGSDVPHARSIPLREYVLRRDAAMIDHLISNATWEADFVYKRRFYGCGKVELFGHPRNDILFGDCAAARRKVAAAFGFAADDRILLYAPTYRNMEKGDFYLHDFGDILTACARRFGGTWRAIVRLHPIMNRKAFRFAADTADGTDYPDIQELMVAADAMVSDYSSCMFDFMLTRRPVFVSAPDLAEYQRVQGFYYPMSETPFPIAQDDRALLDDILGFDDVKYRAGVEEFLKGKGCVEDGHATERVADLIERRLQGQDYHQSHLERKGKFE